MGAKATDALKRDFEALAKSDPFRSADLDNLLARHGLEKHQVDILTIARNWYRFGLWSLDYYRTGMEATPAHWWPDYLAMLAQFAAMGTVSAGLWTVLGTSLRRLLSQPRRLRIFNVTMAALLVATLWPILAAL